MFERKENHVVMVGLGYIGLPTAALFAQSGCRVTGVDINQNVCDTLNAGQIHIVEPGLAEVVRSQVESGRLRATTQAVPADVFVIAVPTPFTLDMKPDLRYVQSAISAIAPVIKEGDLVLLESTSPVGTTEKMSAWLREARPDLHFASEQSSDQGINSVSLAYCPERVLPGNVLHELVNNDRLIGGLDPLSTLRAQEFYQRVVKGACVATNARTAEMAKLVENSFRDVNIAFANELSMLCERLNINVWELIGLANRHPRVNILQPGCGVGGHCIAVDPWFIVDSAPDLARVIKTARLVNDSKPGWVVEQVDKMVGHYLLSHPEMSRNALTIAFYGLSFKPDIDDLRESPAMEIVLNASQRYSGTAIQIVEPHITRLPEEFHHGHAALVTQEQANDAHVKILLVGHTCFKSDPRLKGPYVLNVAWPS